jgi:dolichol kinase
MIELILTTAIGALVVLVSEWLWLRKHIRSELNRKIIHMAHGILVCVWALFTSYYVIILLELVMLLATFIDKRFKIISGARAVTRASWGEFAYIAGIILLALLEPPVWIFIISVLHLALADAAAALIGSTAPKKFRYKVFGQTKSLWGTTGFFVSSLMIVFLGLLMVEPNLISQYPLVVILMPISMAAVENLGVFGVDNLLIPALSVILLNSISG